VFPTLSVAENLEIGEPGSAWLPPQRRNAEARVLLERFDLALDPEARTDTLAVAQMQRLEIARALARGANVLVLDEPTAVLAPSEVDELLALLARLRDEGKSIVLISHKLEEITAVCDRVTVLRAGPSRQSLHGLTRAARLPHGGRRLPPPGPPPWSRARSARALSVRRRARDIDPMRAGGSSRRGHRQQRGPLEELLAGVRARSRECACCSRRSLASGDRHRTGSCSIFPSRRTWCCRKPRRRRSARVLGGAHCATAATARAAIERFEIRAQPDDPARTLSGGNQRSWVRARAARAGLACSSR
jgi:ABC-type uncharacterized transport system ATPase subunit